MFLLELRNQRRHREEIVTADVEHELRIGDVAVKIGQVVDLGNRELEAAVRGIVVLAVLPGWKYFGLGSRLRGEGRCRQDRHQKGGGHQSRAE